MIDSQQVIKDYRRLITKAWRKRTKAAFRALLGPKSGVVPHLFAQSIIERLGDPLISEHVEDVSVLTPAPSAMGLAAAAALPLILLVRELPLTLAILTAKDRALAAVPGGLATGSGSSMRRSSSRS